MGNILAVGSEFSLAQSLQIMHLVGAKDITGDQRFGKWCKMSDTCVQLKDFTRGKWYRYEFSKYKTADGEPDFARIERVFYAQSGCRPNR